MCNAVTTVTVTCSVLCCVGYSAGADVTGRRALRGSADAQARVGEHRQESESPLVGQSLLRSCQAPARLLQGLQALQGGQCSAVQCSAANSLLFYSVTLCCVHVSRVVVGLRVALCSGSLHCDVTCLFLCVLTGPEQSLPQRGAAVARGRAGGACHRLHQATARLPSEALQRRRLPAQRQG